MALSANFTANFSSFYDAVDKAEVKLKEFGDGAASTGTRLSGMVDKFNGRRLIEEATLMAAAIEKIGGTSTLSEAELKKLGATTNDAVTKMKAIGMDVPPKLQAIADKTKDANKAGIDWMGTLGKLAATVGIAFSADAIVSFIGNVFKAASAIEDLSHQWGVSTDAVQRWTGAAKQSGIEAQTLGKSVHFVSEKLTENSKEYDALLRNLGLSGDALRQMKFEDAFMEVVKAVAGIKDQSLQADVAMGVLGPSSKQTLGMIRDEFVKTQAQQKIWSEQSVNDLAQYEKAWGDLKDNVVRLTGELIIATGKYFTDTKKGIDLTVDMLHKFAGDVFATLTGGLDGHKKYMEAIQSGASSTATSLEKIVPAASHAAAAQDAHASTMRTTAQVLADQKAATEATTKAEAARTAALAAAKKTQEEYAKQLQDQADSVAALAARMEGGGIVGQANKYLEALQQSVPVQKMTRAMQDEINKSMKDAIDVYNALGEEAPAALLKVFTATSQGKTIMPDLNDMISQSLDWSKVSGTALDTPPPASMFDGLGKNIAATLGSSIMQNLQSGNMKGALVGASSAIGNMVLDPKESKIGEVVVKAASKLPGLIGTAIGSAIPFVGPLIGPAIGMLATKISSWFGKKEHEKLRDSFVTAAGGISVLREEAEKAGISLDSLMKAKNVDAVKKAMGEIEAAINFQETAVDQAREAASRYGFTLEELGPALARGELDKQAQQLYKDFEVLNSAGIDSVAITDRMAESVQDYVSHAIKMGSEVPSAMKPMLEDFAKAGKLFDENGEAITDLEGSGIKFSMTMSEGFTAMVGSVTKLTDAIERSLGPAIKNMPEPPPMTDAFGRIVNNAKQAAAEIAAATGSIAPPAASTQGAPAAGEAPGYARGTGGFKNFGKGTPVILHGWEAVVPRDDAGAFATVTGGGTSSGELAAGPAIIINAQGAFFDTPESLHRLATKVSDALTAKYSVMGRLRAVV